MSVELNNRLYELVIATELPDRYMPDEACVLKIELVIENVPEAPAEYAPYELP